MTKSLSPRAAPFEIAVRRVVGQELGVDVELADATGDELGELTAEIEDHDGTIGRAIGVGRGRLGGAVGGWRLERRLEVGLHLGVIGGEDTVPGVRRLAVDGLAPLGVGPG